jgi:hypothetical protein
MDAAQAPAPGTLASLSDSEAVLIGLVAFAMGFKIRTRPRRPAGSTRAAPVINMTENGNTVATTAVETPTLIKIAYTGP